MPHETSPSVAPVLGQTSPVPVTGSKLRRLIVGLGLATAAYIGLREWWQATPLLVGWDKEVWPTTLPGLLSLYALQMVAVMIGAGVAAAAQPHGYTLGLCVGLASGTLFFAWEIQHNQALRQAPVLLEIPLVGLVGLLAGWLSERIWPPPPMLVLPQPRSSLLSSLQFTRSTLPAAAAAAPSRPTRWFHILVGTAIGVTLLLTADTLRLTIQRYSLGLFQVQGMGHALFITWLIAVFGLLVGGMIASAGTGSGVRHGMLTGLLTASMVLTYALQREALPPALEYTLTRAGLAGVPLNDPLAAALVLGGILACSTLGGWFGAALFPPLASPALRRPFRSS
ncbi:MAG: hypothetical protein NZU63_00790 [Gemmataceae bacterium]|nr:hypothetical protein [Gemmataceae bacterium]